MLARMYGHDRHALIGQEGGEVATAYRSISISQLSLIDPCWHSARLTN
jgi:hypothetical protein